MKILNYCFYLLVGFLLFIFASRLLISLLVAIIIVKVIQRFWGIGQLEYIALVLAACLYAVASILAPGYGKIDFSFLTQNKIAAPVTTFVQEIFNND